MNVQTLTLANESTTISSEIKNFLLTDLPYGFIDSFDVVRDIRDVLNESVASDDHILHIVVPKSKVDKLGEEPGADGLEFTYKNTTSVDVTTFIQQSVLQS